MKLVILESPNKVKSLEKWLPKNEYKVMSCKGHIVKLPSSGPFGFGVDLETWTPKYQIETTKKKIVTELKKEAKKADEILIATDPDREGEAIADNLVTFLEVSDKYKRIRFNEITKPAVEAALEHPTLLDGNLVNSQIARRILDRIIGYRLSNLMRKKIWNTPSTPSAGRVQSIALKLVVEREREIEAFIPESYFSVDALVDIAKPDVFAHLFIKENSPNLNRVLPTQIEQVKSTLTKQMKVIKKTIANRNEKAITPFKLSSLFKKAESSLGMSSTNIQRVAQRLYEGYGDGGLISYPRTDSTRLSSTFITSAQSWIKEKFGVEYIATSVKGFSGAQDAHEGIRPTDVTLTPEIAAKKFKLEPREIDLYRLIYNHTLQALMSVPRRETLRYELDSNGNLFSLSSSKVIFDGYYKITGYEDPKVLPVYNEGEIIQVHDFIIEAKETQPPARYNDGSLIAKLEEIKVGRPSTFNSIISILFERDYAVKNGKAISVNEFGKVLNDKLLESFPEIINEEYTARMEEDLDQIADGNQEYHELLKTFWAYFNPKVEDATQEIGITELEKKPKREVEYVGRDCPKCGSPLVYRYNNKNGSRFIGCSNFPKCKHTEPDPEGKTLEKASKKTETNTPEEQVKKDA